MIYFSVWYISASVFLCFVRWQIMEEFLWMLIIQVTNHLRIHFCSNSWKKKQTKWLRGLFLKENAYRDAFFPHRLSSVLLIISLRELNYFLDLHTLAKKKKSNFLEPPSLWMFCLFCKLLESVNWLQSSNKKSRFLLKREGFCFYWVWQICQTSDIICFCGGLQRPNWFLLFLFTLHSGMKTTGSNNKILSELNQGKAGWRRRRRARSVATALSVVLHLLLVGHFLWQVLPA